MLYECQDNKIELKKEIELIRNYADLEKMRHGDRLKFTLKIDEGISEGIKIPPLSLFAHIENSFKHGIDQSGVSKIIMYLEQDGEMLKMRVSNPIASQSSSMNGHLKGIGIGNTQKQLDLLFNNNYSLEFSEEKDQFITSLAFPIG